MKFSVAIFDEKRKRDTLFQRFRNNRNSFEKGLIFFAQFPSYLSNLLSYYPRFR